MKRYIAFLRGINISGKNKISMAELKKNFEELGFEEVKTYLNSGNVIFLSDEENIGKLTIQIETMTDVAYYYIDELQALGDIPPSLQNYIDYEAYGRDLDMGGCFIETSRGMCEIPY